MSLESVTHAVNVRREGNVLITLDQTLLPNVTKYLDLTTAEEMWEAIYSLRVRGAPAIGIFAGYAMAILSKQIPAPDFDTFYKLLPSHCCKPVLYAPQNGRRCPGQQEQAP